MTTEIKIIIVCQELPAPIQSLSVKIARYIYWTKHGVNRHTFSSLSSASLLPLPRGDQSEVFCLQLPLSRKALGEQN